MSVASVAGTLLGHLHLPNSPVTLRNVIGPGLCQTTGSFPNGPVTLWPLEIQWPQWSRTLLGHWHFYKGPETWWPWEMSKPSVAWDFVGHLHFPNCPVTLRNVSGLSGPGLWWATGSFPTVAGTLLGHLHLPNSPATLKNVIGPGLCQTTGSFPNGPVTRWPLEISVASVACDFAGALAPFPNNQVTRWPWEMPVASVAQDFAWPLAFLQRPRDLVTLRNVSGLSGPGHCWVTGTFPTAQWPSDNEKCQWPQWTGTLLGHQDFARPLALSQQPSDPVTIRNVNGLSGLGLCQVIATFPTAQWPDGPERCLWPKWPRSLLATALSQRPSDPMNMRNVNDLSGPGHCHFPNVASPVTIRNVSGLSGLGLCWAIDTFPMAQWPGDPEKCQWPQWPGTLPGHQLFPNIPVTHWPREMSVASVAQDFAWPLGLSQVTLRP